AAYRDGASDAEALEAGTGIPAEQLYADFYAEFGVDAPVPIEPEPIAPSNVDRPAAGEIDEGGVVDPGVEPPPPDSAPGEPAAEERGDSLPLLVLLAVAGIAATGGAAWVARRARRASG
ncbi:MAG TPA: hypothetical protein VEW95_04190, partial [Candidatus Limnocylindrales bacterium]|nr:hypothetical protein [Candidatus Limnocylindrales bacterium]